MKSPFLASLAVMTLLAGCGGTQTVTYTLTFKTEDAALQTELTKMALRVIERRVVHLDGTLDDINVAGEGGERKVTATVTGKDVAENLTAELTAPYGFLLVREAEPGEEGGQAIGEYGTFVETGLNETHLLNVEWAEDNEKKGALKINLTPEGTELLKTISNTHDGKQIALIVRGALMSRSEAQAGQDKLIIRGVPTADMAQVFSEDTNVALYVTFTPTTNP